MSHKTPDNNNNGLLKLLKKLWLPVAGFIGAVTLAYNFYQLWLGDQATVTYFLAGGGLVVLVIALLWVEFKTDEVEVKFSTPFAPKLKETVHRYPLALRKFARISLFVLFISAIASFMLAMQHRNALEEKLVVLIAAFDGPEEVYGLRNEIIENLNADFSGDEEIEIID